jgi:hypothetical protein
MKKAIIILFHFLLINNLIAQQIKVTRDLGVWGVVNIEKNYQKNLKLP